MSNPVFDDPVDAVPIPGGAIELEGDLQACSLRELAVQALQCALRERQLLLPLGPETAFGDAQRLLNLNRFAIQLVTAGLCSDQVSIDLASWESDSTAPQLLLAALVDEENAIVSFPGVLTGAEFLAIAREAQRNGQVLPVETQCFAGGLERLLTVVQLLDPEVFPRLALASLQGSITRSAVVVVDWLRGRLDDALSALGGELTPVAAGAFRSGSLGSETDDQRLAMLVIPLGLSGEQLVTGEAARCCVRKFQLALIPTAADDTTQPSALVVRVSSAVPGALLPDGLQLDARQGNHHQSMRSSMSTDIELVFQASDQWLDVSLRYRDGDPIALPSLELPG